MGTPQIDIGEAAAVAGTVIRDGSQQIGTLEVERLGDKITVTANFSRRPPGRRAAICLKVDRRRQAAASGRTSKRGLKLTLDHTADFSIDLRATARSGEAFGAVETLRTRRRISMRRFLACPAVQWAWASSRSRSGSPT